MNLPQREGRFPASFGKKKRSKFTIMDIRHYFTPCESESLKNCSSSGRKLRLPWVIATKNRKWWFSSNLVHASDFPLYSRYELLFCFEFQRRKIVCNQSNSRSTKEPLINFVALCLKFAFLNLNRNRNLEKNKSMSRLSARKYINACKKAHFMAFASVNTRTCKVNYNSRSIHALIVSMFSLLCIKKLWDKKQGKLNKKVFFSLFSHFCPFS